MPTINVNVDQAKELVLLKEGEYKLSVISAECRTSQNGNPYLNVRFSVEGQPMAEDIYHMLMLPKEGEDERVANRKLLRFKEFYAAFNIKPVNGEVDLDKLGGKTGWGFVRVESDDEYGEKNRIARFMPKR